MKKFKSNVTQLENGTAGIQSKVGCSSGFDHHSNHKIMAKLLVIAIATPLPAQQVSHTPFYTLPHLTHIAIFISPYFYFVFSQLCRLKSLRSRFWQPWFLQRDMSKKLAHSSPLAFCSFLAISDVHMEFCSHVCAQTYPIYNDTIICDQSRPQ